VSNILEFLALELDWHSSQDLLFLVSLHGYVKLLIVTEYEQYSFAYPLLAAMVLSLLNALYIIAVLPESRQGERKPFQWKKSNPFHSFYLIGQQKLVFCILIALFVLQTGEWGKSL
jgi:hypothetical protein